MIDNISDMNDLTRLYQLYIMTDKILTMQNKSSTGINYNTLKTFKAMSIRINYLHMQDSINKIEKLDYKSKDIYDEQQRLTREVKILEDVSEARSILINKYRKYSALPLVLDDFIELNNLDYLRDKLKYINEYIKNESYIDKLDNTLNQLGINLGNKVKEEEELLELIPIYEKKLMSILLDNEETVNDFTRIGFDIRELSHNDSKLIDKYNKIEYIYNEVKDKYEAMCLIDDRDYSDVVREISDEYNSTKNNKYIMEILKLLFLEKKDYDDFYEKRINIKNYLMELGNSIFDREFVNLLNKQLEMCEKINFMQKDILNMKEEINRNNSLLSRIKNNQVKLMESISKKKEIVSEEDMNNRITNIKDSYVNYSKERVNKVLKFVNDKLNSLTESNDAFVEENIPFENMEQDNHFDERLFKTEFEPFDKLNEKVESYDDIFIDNSNKIIDSDVNYSNDNVFNNELNSEITNSNIQFMNSSGSFWPNIG